MVLFWWARSSFPVPPDTIIQVKFLPHNILSRLVRQEHRITQSQFVSVLTRNWSPYYSAPCSGAQQITLHTLLRLASAAPYTCEDAASEQYNTTTLIWSTYICIVQHFLRQLLLVAWSLSKSPCFSSTIDDSIKQILSLKPIHSTGGIRKLGLLFEKKDHPA